MLTCYYCNIEFDEDVHSRIDYITPNMPKLCIHHDQGKAYVHSIKDKENKPIIEAIGVNFCSSFCAFKYLAVVATNVGTLDKSWIPVINQLHESLNAK